MKINIDLVMVDGLPQIEWSVEGNDEAVEDVIKVADALAKRFGYPKNKPKKEGLV